jgi:transcriptional regulator with XRE-family HTH domain
MDSASDIIKALRLAGFSQSEIARQTGISQPRVSRWEGGEGSDSADDALKLLRLYTKVCKTKPVKPAKV